MITRKELTGIWYNDNFKLIVEEDRIMLNTNIDTKHKPFYTKDIYSEKINWIENEKTIKVSENIVLLKDGAKTDVIVISITTDRIELIRLVKFE